MGKLKDFFSRQDQQKLEEGIAKTKSSFLSRLGKVVVGKKGKVEGEINCSNADISGEVNAKTNVSQLLSLKATAKLFGDIVINKLAIEPGASFTGKCSMGESVVKDIKDGEKKQAQEKQEKTA